MFRSSGFNCKEIINMQCRFCQSKNTTIISKIKSPHFHTFYYLYHCHECQCRFFNHLEHDLDIQEFYLSLSHSHNATKDPEFKRSKSWNHLKEKLICRLGKNPKSILDVGCRTGDFLMHFDENMIREGVELSEQYAKIGSQRGLSIFNNFLEKIDFNRNYDIVSCLAILEHLINPLKFLNKLNGLVNSQGILIIMIPTYECLKEQILRNMGLRWHMYSPPEHLNFYSKYYLDGFMNQNGFTLIEREYTSGGSFNPFVSIKILKKIFGKVMVYFDRSIFNRIPIFDHMYSIYKKSV
jgi:SAM-dependent methyltransferase